jgi:hypothetical protein
MCNLYSITTNQAAIIALFRVMSRYVGNLPPMPGVFPDYRDRTHLVAFNEGNRILAAGGLMAKGKMTMPRPQQWTEAEVNRLRMFAKRKVGSDKIAKSLGRYVGSVKIKARELNLILSRRLKAKGK